DVGAHVGFYTLLASELVGKTGKVFAFEPLPRNINYLKKHININKCKNITIIENALSNKSGNSFFKINSSSSTGQITNKEGLKIISATIDNLVFKNKLPVPHSLKIDVEGAELSVLRGAINTLKKYYPAIFLSTHSSEINKHCRNLLSGLGYNLKSISGNSIEKTNEIFAYKK
ncbi:MAG TPA: FkbM family methyltransferase, partial [Candidatus Wolfebacteria bacterium]|nr:FkbM family methyltransferase [Candidatus Wolfebacteria bacterium]